MVHSSSSTHQHWMAPFRSVWKALSSLGDVWENESAESAFRSKTLTSTQGGASLRLVFRNCTPLPLVLCWVSEQGTPHHFYSLEPFRGRPQDPISDRDHLERSSVGHAFVFGHENENPSKATSSKTFDSILGGYRPTKTNTRRGDSDLHIVTILPSKPDVRRCCDPQPQRERQYIRIHVESREFDNTPIDTSQKCMDHCVLGGWPARLEPNCFDDDKELKQLFCNHIKHAVSCLPEHARNKLIDNTPLFINKSLKYGPAACPIKGRGMCFHPSPHTWLEDMGMSTDKCEAIEIYQASEYWDDHDCWGPGGVFVHEMSHAYHWKCVKDGYDNKEIKNCYDQAMKEGLYNCVKVHGPQGPVAKAYASTNQMEYFAELSTAFLGGLDGDGEYNKWYPFNRSQVREHDPRAYKMLQRIWKVDCEDNES